jgi:hypothetical protein
MLIGEMTDALKILARKLQGTSLETFERRSEYSIKM